MPARRKMPSDSILERWIEEGLDDEQIRQRIKKSSTRTWPCHR